MRPSRSLIACLWTVAAGAAVLNVLGALHVPYIPMLGYTVDADGVVSDVTAGGAGETAGLELGDRVLRVDGRDYRPEVEQPVSLRAGDRRILEVERNGARSSLDFVTGSLPLLSQRLGLLFGLSGLLFIVAGPLLYQRSGSSHALAFAATGISLGLVQGYRPLAPTALLHELLVFSYGALGALCTAFLIHFALLFPRRRQVATHRGWLALLYGPSATQILLLAVALIVPSTATTTARLADIVSLGGQLYLVHVLVLIALLVAGFVQTDAAERRRRGLGVLLWGTLAAVAPILIAGLWALAAPDTDSEVLIYAFVPSLALPLILAYPVWKSDRASPG